MLNTLQSKENSLIVYSSRTISTSMACYMTGLCYSTFYAKAKKLKVSYTKFGKKILYKLSSVLNFITQHKAGDWTNVFDEQRIIRERKCDLKEYSKESGICYQTLYSALKDRQIPHFRFDHKIVVSPIIMRSYMDNSEGYDE